MSNETETDDILQEVAKDLLTSYIPVIVFLILLAFLGITGNVTATWYFGHKKKKSSTEMFITVLAVVDLIVCLLISLYVAQLFVNISVYTNKFLCKASYFIYHWGILLSVSILSAVAVDRFKKICRPFGEQFTCTTAKRISLALTLASGVISSRDFLTYDSFAVNVTISDITVEGRLCMNTRSETLEWAVRASHIIDAFIVSVIFVILIFTYVGIIYSLYKHRQHMEEKVFKSGVNLRVYSNDVTDSPSEDSRKSSKSIPDSVQRASVQFKQNISKSERSTTLMMLAASVGLLICFVPYFVATLIKLRETDIEYELTAWYRFAISSVLANSVINPIVYCVFNPKYRRYLMNLPTRCIKRGQTNYMESPTESIDT